MQTKLFRPYLCAPLLGLVLSLLGSPCAAALDLLPGFLEKQPITKKIWRDQEQYIALAPQDKDGETPSANQHPVTLAPIDVQDALRSLELWVEGGLFRNEAAVRVFTDAQTSVLARYLAEALETAKPREDVVFVVRGYGRVAFDVAKERFWTSGRVFYTDGRLNLIVGSYQVKKDRGIKQAEAAHGILDNYKDIFFEHGSRHRRSKMPGQIVSTAGIDFAAAQGATSRPDWIRIDVDAAKIAYREGQIPQEERERTEKVKAEAAKLTMERRQMREEMARLRQELKELKSAGVPAASARSLEERLATLQDLHAKELISDAEYRRRRDEILNEI